MIRTLLVLIFLLGSTLCFAQRKKNRESQNFKLEELAPGVWAAIQNDQYGKAFCNAGIVDLGDKTLIFDAFTNPRAAAELMDVAERLTKRPVSFVVNSHFHSDHIRGNQVFKPMANIISTSITRDMIAKMEPLQKEWDKQNASVFLKANKKIYNSSYGLDRAELPLWIGYYEGLLETIDDLELTLPDMVFNDSLWIIGTKLDVKLVEFKNCHTGSDVVMYIPSLKIAFMGDLLFVHRHPWLADGDPINWQEQLNKVYADLSVDTFVPGHGQVGDKKTVKELADYLGNVHKLAIESNGDSTRTASLMQQIPAPYRDWYFARYYQSNIQFIIHTATVNPR